MIGGAGVPLSSPRGGGGGGGGALVEKGAEQEKRKKKWGEGGKGRLSCIYVSMVVVVDDGLWFINSHHSQRRSLAIFKNQ